MYVARLVVCWRPGLNLGAPVTKRAIQLRVAAVETLDTIPGTAPRGDRQARHSAQLVNVVRALTPSHGLTVAHAMVTGGYPKSLSRISDTFNLT